MTNQEKIKLILQFSGLTQEVLAKEIGVSFATVNSWANGRSEPRARMQVVIDAVYSKYSGQDDIPHSIHDAKMALITSKSVIHKNIVKKIMANPDVYQEFMLLLTYNSNKMEGSTLTQNETADILFENKTIVNKNIIEHLEVKNHYSALSYLFNHILKHNKIDQLFIKKLHSILMNAIRDDAGIYRNHGVRIVGSRVATANHLSISKKMKELEKSIYTKSDIISHVSKIHSQFEQIHPFSDGNGRIGRLLMHAMLLKKGIAPAVILQEEKRMYITYLQKSQIEKRFSMLENFVADAVLRGFELLEKR